MLMAIIYNLHDCCLDQRLENIKKRMARRNYITQAYKDIEVQMSVGLERIAEGGKGVRETGSYDFSTSSY